MHRPIAAVVLLTCAAVLGGIAGCGGNKPPMTPDNPDETIMGMDGGIDEAPPVPIVAPVADH